MPPLIVQHDDAALLDHRAHDFLMRREVEHCFILGLLTSTGPGPLLWLTVEAAGDVVGVAAQNRPIALAVSRLQAGAIAPLVDHLAAIGWSGQGFVGPVESVDALADGWEARSGRSKRVLVSLRLFELTKVVPPPPAPGRMVPTTIEHLDLLTAWHVDFHRCIGHPVDDARGSVTRIVEQQRLFAWEDDGQFRALAAFAGPTPTGIRINHVYTPPEFRGRGYASNLVAALSQRMLDGGRKFCSLFTDQANPTSNKIYQRIGYRPVAEFRHWEFEGG